VNHNRLAGAGQVPAKNFDMVVMSMRALSARIDADDAVDQIEAEQKFRAEMHTQ
jgi:hypothetical protein